MVTRNFKVEGLQLCSFSFLNSAARNFQLYVWENLKKSATNLNLNQNLKYLESDLFVFRTVSFSEVKPAKTEKIDFGNCFDI
jgi:hypothetical protein